MNLNEYVRINEYLMLTVSTPLKLAYEDFYYVSHESFQRKKKKVAFPVTVSP